MRLHDGRYKEISYKIHRSDALGVKGVGRGLIWDALSVPNQHPERVVAVGEQISGRILALKINIKNFSERQFGICAQIFFGLIPDFAGRIFNKLAGFCNKTYFYLLGPIFNYFERNIIAGFCVDYRSGLI